MSSPRVSIILPVRRAQSTIAQTIASLLEQCEDRSVELIIAVCRTDPSLEQLATVVRKPLRLLVVDGRAGVPQLRSYASLQARGDFIVITEDNCRFQAGWLASLIEAAEAHPGAVCGGPVDNGRRSLSGWAQYFTRYSAFLPPSPAGAAGNLPGNNACYPAKLITDRLAHLENGFWEAEFNQTLGRDGVSFHLMPELAVTQYQDRSAIEYVPLRFRHGRCYGARRVAELTISERRRLLFLSPALPLLLFFRIARAVARARWHRLVFLAASPLIVIYVFAWSLGEIVGYLAGPGGSCTDTD